MGGLGGCCHFTNPQPREYCCCQRAWRAGTGSPPLARHADPRLLWQRRRWLQSLTHSHPHPLHPSLLKNSRARHVPGGPRVQYGKESRRGETGKAACALRELPRRPRSEAAAPVRHCEPPPGLPPARPPLWVPVHAAMGHLPASTRGGRRLLPLLGLFVLLKVGSPAPRPQSSRRPSSAPGSAATDLGAPGREGRAAGSAGRAAGRTLCCPGGCACPALLGDVVGEGGSLLSPAFNLCALLPTSEVGLLVTLPPAK